MGEGERGRRVRSEQTEASVSKLVPSCCLGRRATDLMWIGFAGGGEGLREGGRWRFGREEGPSLAAFESARTGPALPGSRHESPCVITPPRAQQTRWPRPQRRRVIDQAA
jgi:hypothetical protein